MQPQRTSQPPEAPQPPALWRRVLRIVVSIALLAALFFSIDWSTVPTYAERLTPTLAVLVVAIFAAQLAISSWKWQWALRIHRLDYAYPFLTRVLIIGFFLNN